MTVSLSFTAAIAAIGALCSAALVAAALWLEHCCRTPDDDEGP